MWDTSGHPIGDPLIGHSLRVFSVAVGRLGDRDMIVSGSQDGTARTWGTAGHSGGWLRDTDVVVAVAVGRIGDRHGDVRGLRPHNADLERQRPPRWGPAIPRRVMYGACRQREAHRLATGNAVALLKSTETW
jgi:hypothetical protein